MSVRRTPGVTCQCQAGTPVDTGTLARGWGALAGPTIEEAATLSAASTIVRTLEQQTPVCMSWETLENVANLARAGGGGHLASSLGVSLSQAIYAFAVRQVATEYLDVREQGNNRGTEVEGFLESGGGRAGQAWCAAFVFHCHYEAASFLCADTTCPRTLSAVFMIFDGRTAGNLTFTKQDVINGSRTPLAGDVFSMVHEGPVSALNSGQPRRFKRGHTGIVVSYDASRQILTTIEGNTNDAGSREGDGVYMRTDRMSSQRLWGFMRPRPVWQY